MHFNWFFSTKDILRCVLKRKIIRLPFFPYQSLLLSTNVLNDVVVNHHGWQLNGINGPLMRLSLYLCKPLSSI